MINSEKIRKNKYYILVGVCCFVILILGIYMISKNVNKNIIKINIDGTEKTINLENKNFQEICSRTSGLWMPKSMAMSELRNGISIDTKKCSGCMPNSKNMFCEQEDYLDYINTNGVNTSDFNMK